MPIQGVRLQSDIKGAQHRALLGEKQVSWFKELAPTIRTSHIRDADTPVSTHGRPTTLRQVILALTYPLVPPTHKTTGEQIVVLPDGTIKLNKDGVTFAKPEPLFHTVERMQGDTNEHAFITWRDREAKGKGVAAILPAIVSLLCGKVPKEWFHKNADQIVKQVIFEFDEDSGEWTGNWTTKADEEIEAMVLESTPGLNDVHIDNIQMLLQSSKEKKDQQKQTHQNDEMSANASVNSAVFNAAFGRPQLPNGDDSTVASEATTSGDTTTENESTQQQGQGSEPPDASGEAGHSSAVTGLPG